MSTLERLALAQQADFARHLGMPGLAGRLERELSEAMVAEYQAFAAHEAERQIAEHHRRRPRFRG